MKNFILPVVAFAIDLALVLALAMKGAYVGSVLERDIWVRPKIF